MGHAHYKNLSRFFIRLLYARGTLTVHAATQQAVKVGESLQASCGSYDDPLEIAMALAEVVNHWERAGAVKRVTDNLTPEQERALFLWEKNRISTSEDWQAFDTVSWRFAPGWRNRYSTGPYAFHCSHCSHSVPHLGSVTY